MPVVTVDPGWRKSSYSAANGNCPEVAIVGWRTSSSCDSGACIEVGHGPAVVGIRDSKDPDGVVLAFRGEDWERFTDAVKRDAATC